LTVAQIKMAAPGSLARFRRPGSGEFGLWVVVRPGHGPRSGPWYELRHLTTGRTRIVPVGRVRVFRRRTPLT
jgi:hypothetical protein